MPVDWIKAVAEVSQTDLDGVTARLSDLHRETESLRTLKRVFEARLGIKPPPDASHKAKPKPPAEPNPTPSPRAAPYGSLTSGYRTAMAKYLLHAGTPVKPVLLAAECKVPGGSLGGVLDCPWFERKPDGIVLTPEGRRAFADA